MIRVISVLFFLPAIVIAQTLTNEQIWNRTFSPNIPDEIHSLKDGTQYSVLKSDLDKKKSTIIV